MAEDIVELVKGKNRIEDVIQETGVALGTKRGRYIHGQEHDSLVVDTTLQAYFWNSQGESGDVINWVCARKKWDFKTAVEWLARRAKLPEPEWGREDNEVRLAARAREDALTVAARVFVKRLVRGINPPGKEGGVTEGMVYALARGWSEETIRAAGLGFTGAGSAEERRDLEGELRLNGVEPSSPGWKAVMGLPAGMLVYPHVYGGRVRYLSTRSIEGKRHYNLPVEVAGPRQVFFNHTYGPNEGRVVLVEGQADAVTLGQWGIPAVALAGTSWKDHEGLLKELRERHEDVFVGVDGDAAGWKALEGKDGDWPLGKVLGPMARVVRWPGAKAPGKGTDQERGIKDANDVLKLWVQEGVENGEQVKRVEGMLGEAQPLALVCAGWAGGKRGADQDRAVRTAVGLIAQMDRVLLAKYREAMANRLGLGIRDFNNVLKEAKGSEEKEGAVEVVETFGGIVGDWVLEYLWDEETGKARLAFRDPEGKIGAADYVEIEGVRYVARHPNSLVEQKGVLFPSEVGPKKSTRELVAIVEGFINQHFYLTDRFFGRMAAYYVLLTWLFDAFGALPYLRAMGDYGSGKSELMKRIGHVCYRMISMGSALTSASLFRMLEEYRGTAFLDEMDLADGGDMANDVIKVLNLGAMKGNPVIRMDMVVLPDGTRRYEPMAHDVYGPKLIAMRKDFRDQAVSSRCLTIKLMGAEPLELRARGIQLHLDEKFFDQARAIRNLLVRFRLERWQREILVDEDLMDIEVPARLNQVTMPLKAIAQDDPQLMADIVSFVRALNADLVLERGMGVDARVMEAVVEIFEEEVAPGVKNSYMASGAIDGAGLAHYAYLKHVAKVTNELIEKMNEDEPSEKDEGQDERRGKRKRDEVTSRTVGTICRRTLQLQVVRKGEGYVVVYDESKMLALKVKYGLASAEEVARLRGVADV